jgi:hypothetical protein
MVWALTYRATAARSGWAQSGWLLRARISLAVKSHTAAFNGLVGMVRTAQSRCGLTCSTCGVKSWCPPAPPCAPAWTWGDPVAATKVPLRRLARRCMHLRQEIADAEVDLQAMLTQLAPQLLEIIGCRTDTAAQLLITAGDNPQRVHNEAAWSMLCGVAANTCQRSALTFRPGRPRKPHGLPRRERLCRNPLQGPRGGGWNTWTASKSQGHGCRVEQNIAANTHSSRQSRTFLRADQRQERALSESIRFGEGFAVGLCDISTDQPSSAANNRPRNSSSGIRAAASGLNLMVPLLVTSSEWRLLKPASRPGSQP